MVHYRGNRIWATKVSAAGSVRAGERERTNNVLDGNPRGEEVHRESGVVSKGGIRDEAARVSESEHTTSRSHLPHSTQISQRLFTSHKDKQYCLKLTFMISLISCDTCTKDKGIGVTNVTKKRFLKRVEVAYRKRQRRKSVNANYKG